MPEHSDFAAEEFLQARHVSKRFGSIHALTDVQLCCAEGEIHVLIGENGAGKSTIVKILCGVTSKDEGEIFIDGQLAVINNAQDAESYGIASVFQELSLISELSVAENIFLGREPVNKLGHIQYRQMYDKAGDFLKELGLTLNVRQLVRNLSLCEKQLVEIAKALYRQPKILILDEATSALGDHEVKWLFEKVRQLTKEYNKTVIFISHRMDELHQIADRATIFRDSRFIMTFDWGELTEDEIVGHISGKVREETLLKRNSPLNADLILEVEHGFKDGALFDINLKLHRGEILGIAGLSGHGQVELLHALYGDDPMEAGTIKMDNKKIRIRNERNALNNGIVLVPEDRKAEGLLLERPISENLTLMALKKIQTFGILRKKLEERYIRDNIGKLAIKADDVTLPANSLSGGNQQKVVISKALMADVKVLLLSDPTRGIDVGTKSEIYRLMNSLVEEGIAIIFFSTELTELTRLCDRVLVFYEGKVAAELTGDNITEENIIVNSLGANVGGKVNEK